MAGRVSRERELLKRWFSEFGRICCNKNLLIETKELLAQPERDKKSKVDFQTLNEMGLKRLQVSDTLVLQESCSRSPTLILAENGEVIDIIGYKKVLEIKSFIDEILNYADTPTREPLMTDSDIRTHTPFHYHDAEKKAFALGVRWAEEQHKIGENCEQS